MSPVKSSDSRRIDELKKDIEIIRDKVFNSDVKIARIEESTNYCKKEIEENSKLTREIHEKVNQNSISIAKMIGWGAGGGAILMIIFKIAGIFIK
ncbi:MAG: hypothetical protein Q7R52_02840 [archaeon]|nr:hypothetical protein [archaeon]